jgi:hypothetical protein
MTKPIRFLHAICPFSGWSCLVYQPAWNVLSSAMKIERECGQSPQKNASRGTAVKHIFCRRFLKYYRLFNIVKYLTSDL